MAISEAARIHEAGNPNFFAGTSMGRQPAEALAGERQPVAAAQRRPSMAVVQ
jgi:hypothetical protein